MVNESENRKWNDKYKRRIEKINRVCKCDEYK